MNDDDVKVLPLTDRLRGFANAAAWRRADAEVSLVREAADALELAAERMVNAEARADAAELEMGEAFKECRALRHQLGNAEHRLMLIGGYLADGHPALADVAADEDVEEGVAEPNNVAEECVQAADDWVAMMPNEDYFRAERAILVAQALVRMFADGRVS